LCTAPELGDDLPLSVCTDVFSFGMMMWQVLHPSVRNPFGVLPNVIMRKLFSGHRPDFMRADAPSALRDLVARCLDHNPSQRPSSMWEVHRELKAILQQLPDTSPPSSLDVFLCDAALAVPSSALHSGAISLANVSMTSDFAEFVRARVRREAAGVRISRTCRVRMASTRITTYMELFSREMNSRASNPMLRPANRADV
jgi:serine/threonine protein kinase